MVEVLRVLCRTLERLWAYLRKRLFVIKNHWSHFGAEQALPLFSMPAKEWYAFAAPVYTRKESTSTAYLHTGTY